MADVQENRQTQKPKKKAKPYLPSGSKWSPRTLSEFQAKFDDPSQTSKVSELVGSFWADDGDVLNEGMAHLQSLYANDNHEVFVHNEIPDEAIEQFTTYQAENPAIKRNPMFPIFQLLAEFFVKKSSKASAQRHAAEEAGRLAKQETTSADSVGSVRQRRASVTSIISLSSEGTLDVLSLPETETQRLQDAFVSYLVTWLFGDELLEWVSARNAKRKMHVAYMQ
jgi:hypothetical protein